LGATSLTGLSNIGLYPLLLAFQIILAVHIVIGAVYTYRSLHGGQINYWHLNQNLWIRRLSGILVLIAALCHAYLFDHLAFLGMQTRTALYTATNLILLVSLFVHIKYNAAAYIIAHGARHYNRRVVDFLIFLCVFFFYFAFANIYFYLN